MLTYSIIILLSVMLIAGVNALIYSMQTFWQYLLTTTISTVVIILVDGILAIIIRRLPEKLFEKDKKIFKVTRAEKQFYEKLKIRKWKDYIPDLGVFTNFQKRKVEKPKDNSYLTRYMLEACYGEVIHTISCFVGFVTMFLPFGFNVTVPVCVVNFILNFLPTFVLRYNFYKMRILFEKNKQQLQQNSDRSQLKEIA